MLLAVTDRKEAPAKGAAENHCDDRGVGERCAMSWPGSNPPRVDALKSSE